MKKSQEKIATQADQKVKNIDESRRGAELQIEVLTRTNGDLLTRFEHASVSSFDFLKITNGEGILATVVF
jgi:hypothetical protein